MSDSKSLSYDDACQLWDCIMHPPVVGFPPPVGMDFIPIFPQMYTSSWRPSSKGWEDKRIPDCKVYFNNVIAAESTWGKSEEVKFFQGLSKPVLKANQVAVALSTMTKPTSSTGSKPLIVVTPQSIAGDCEPTFKWVGNNQAVVLATAAAAAAMVTVETEKKQDLPPANTQPYILTLSPIKIPFLTTHLPDKELLFSEFFCLKEIYSIEMELKVELGSKSELVTRSYECLSITRVLNDPEVLV
ncbi:transcription elongation regulator 1-like protein [Mustelus asterias]